MLRPYYFHEKEFEILIRLKRNKVLRKSKRPAGSILLYVAGSVVGILGIAYLVTNIVLYQKSVTEYVAQGYAVADVTSQLLLSQLLPGIYEPIAVYGGIALILFGVGMINQKLSKCHRILGDIGEADAELDVDENVGVDSSVREVETNALQSDELGASEPKAVEIAESETVENDFGSLKSDPS